MAGTVTLTGCRTPWAHAIRYHLSNGWFIDGATKSFAYFAGNKYTLYEPGGDPSGCAALRGCAPTLKLAVAVANGGVVCGRAQFGCRNLATGRRAVDLGSGREGHVYHCDDHQIRGEYQTVDRTATGH